jgi:hypothetical protein
MKEEAGLHFPQGKFKENVAVDVMYIPFYIVPYKMHKMSAKFSVSAHRLWTKFGSGVESTLNTEKVTLIRISKI